MHHAWSNGYVAVNERFADAVVAELEREPDAAVFFHDYHLYLAPRLVRERGARTRRSRTSSTSRGRSRTTGTCCPSDDPRRVHDGLLANDVVGFHTDRWRRNFVRACDDILGATSTRARRRSATTAEHARHAQPISVDPAEFDELRGERRRAARREREIVARRPEMLVVRVDRTDPSKNIVRGFRAFALFLDAHPELHGRVAMLALLDPSRQDIPEYSEYLAAIQREAREP